MSHQEETASPIIIDTDNFHEVLKHFDEDGHLKHDEASTQISIQCSICMDRNLAIPSQGVELTDATHEKFTVLSCGHGFGYICAYEWLVQSHWDNNPGLGQGPDGKPYRAHCPLCRKPVSLFYLGMRGTRVRIPPLFLARDRADDMRRVRAALAPAVDGEGGGGGGTGGVDPRSIRAILSERDDPGTIPAPEWTALMENFGQLGYDYEMVAFLNASFADSTFELTAPGHIWMYKKDTRHMGALITDILVDRSGVRPFVNICVEEPVQIALPSQDAEVQMSRSI